MIAQALTLITGFWVARMLGPSNYGIWNAVSLVLAYGAYMELGALSAMGRDLPFYIGKDDVKKAAVVEGTARRVTISGAFLGALFVLSFSFLPSHSPMMALGLQTMAVALILQQVYAYHRTVLRSHNHFGELSRQQVLLAVLNSGLAVVFVVFLELEGRMIAAVLAQAAIVLYAVRRNPWRLVPKFEWHEAWSLMRVGIPILISGFILSLLVTIDRLMIITFLGEKQLGFFGLALLLSSVVSLIPSMASQVLYPRITFQFGNSGKSIESLQSFVLTPPKILSALLPIIIGLLYLSLPMVISALLPAYSQGITAARIVVVGIFFFGILGLTDYFLVTTGKLKQYALFGCFALLLNIVLDCLFLWLGYGIEGIAVGGTLITYFFYSCIVIGYALSHYTKQLDVWVRFFLRIWAPFIYMVALLWFTQIAVNFLMSLVKHKSLMVATVAQMLLYMLGCMPLIYIAMRELKLDFSTQSLQKLMR
jgi:O-antigen/teichoic acid export membrane protein